MLFSRFCLFLPQILSVMKDLVLSQFNRLPEHLQEEVLHFIQFLLQKNESPDQVKKAGQTDFHGFPFP